MVCCYCTDTSSFGLLISCVTGMRAQTADSHSVHCGLSTTVGWLMAMTLYLGGRREKGVQFHYFVGGNLRTPQFLNFQSRELLPFLVYSNYVLILISF